MAQATFSIRMDENLKKQFENLCSDFGITTSSAISIFAQTAVREKKMPFEILSPEPEITREKAMQTFLSLRNQAKENGVQDMTPEEINMEILRTRYEEDEL